jgi:threonine synthase
MAIRFVSTGGGGTPVPWVRAIDGGTAPDGGVWVPEAIPPTFEGDRPAARGTEFASWAFPRAVEWLDGTVAPEGIADALDLPVRVRPLGPRIDLLDLSRGPTGAFKDVGARFLAALWERAPRSDGSPRTVLTATSGDTGGAVAAAVAGVAGLRGVVVFPLGRVSEVQRRQFTGRGDAVRALAVRGTFDDCQAVVRAAFGDPALVAAHGLVSANSINPGRLLPQALYYGWLAAVAPGRPVIVPSGNLGNVTAAVIARAMGARLGPIHAAVNENDALVRAIDGVPPRAGSAVHTDASAMDVAVPSNLERLRWLAASSGSSLGEMIEARSIGVERARAAQRSAYARHGIVVDPHTAVGVAAAIDLVDREPDCRPIVVETAHPAKFPDVVRRVLGVDPPPMTGLAPDGEERWTVIEPEVEALARELSPVLPA